jgi:YebC/PmpR family DNA-binding regulatory protein
MSGHSKWATIKHKKGAIDAKRGKVFSRISKELTVAARAGGGDPNFNPTLRTLVLKAKAANMPNDNVQRAIKKGTGELEGAALEEIVYEGYASGGVGIVVKALTDNKNRASSEIRHIFAKHGSSFATPGAVSRGFERKGQIVVNAAGIKEDDLMTIVLDAGADDMVQMDDTFEITTTPAAHPAVAEALEKAKITPVRSEVGMVPTSPVPVSEKSTASSVMKFVDDLEENDDVQDVYTNMDASDEILQALAAE